MTSVLVHLPTELVDYIDVLRSGEASRKGRGWTSLPPSRGEVIESLLWKAHQRFYGEV